MPNFCPTLPAIVNLNCKRQIFKMYKISATKNYVYQIKKQDKWISLYIK